MSLLVSYDKKMQYISLIFIGPIFNTYLNNYQS